MDLIIFPYHDWKKVNTEGFRGRDSHLINGLKKSGKFNKIVVFNRPNTFLEKVKNKSEKFPFYSGAEIIEKGQYYQVSKYEEDFFIVDFYLTGNFSQIFKKRVWWSRALVNKKIKEYYFNIIEKHCENPIYLTFNPFSYKIINYINPETLIYDVFDDFSHHPRFNHKEQQEASLGFEFLLKKANIVVKVTEDLKLNKSKEDVSLIKNGFADYFLEKETSIPDISSFEKGLLQGKKIVGYSGRISKRLNVELIKKTSTAFPDCNFLFIGEVYDRKWIKDLHSLNNVYFIGSKMNKHLPFYFDHFSAAIVPHHTSDFENGGNSIKVYEYLARGLSVVSTSIGGTNDIEKGLYNSSTDEEFIKNLDYVLRNQKNKIENTHNIKNLSWNSKVQSYLDIFEKVKKQ